MADRWRNEEQDWNEDRHRYRRQGEGQQGGQQDRPDQFGEGRRHSGHRQEFGEGFGEERGFDHGRGEDRFGGGYGGQGRSDMGFRGPGYGGGGFGGENWPGGQDRAGRGARGGGFGSEDWQRQEGRGFGETWRGGSQQSRHGGEQQRSWIGRAADAIFGNDTGEYGRDTDRQRGHFGKGPKGYTRSDDRIRDDVNDRLTDDWQVDASNIEVQVSSCEVSLTGTVNSREEKRRAEDIAEQVSGVKHVQNNLRVQQGAHTTPVESGKVGAGTTSGEATARSRK